MSAVTQILTKELKGRVLVASPHAALREQMLRRLAVPNASVSEAQGGADAILKLEKSDFGTLLLDPRIEDLDVGELMATLRVRYPNLDVVLMESDPLCDEDAAQSAPSKASARTGMVKTQRASATVYPAAV